MYPFLLHVDTDDGETENEEETIEVDEGKDGKFEAGEKVDVESDEVDKGTKDGEMEEEDREMDEGINSGKREDGEEVIDVDERGNDEMDIGRNDGDIHGEKGRELSQGKNDGEREVGKKIGDLEDREVKERKDVNMEKERKANEMEGEVKAGEKIGKMEDEKDEIEMKQKFTKAVVMAKVQTAKTEIKEIKMNEPAMRGRSRDIYTYNSLLLL